MKTSLKILLLIVFFLAGVSGVLVFAKTQVAPPTSIKMTDQYAQSLKDSCTDFDKLGTQNDFSKTRAEYVRLDDKLNRFLSENVIDASVSDEYRKSIDATFGTSLTNYGFNLFQKSVWPEESLNDMLSMLNALKSDKLSNGESAVTPEFVNSANKIAGIVNDYHAALRLSKNASYNGMSDAIAKMNQASRYSSAEYLSNNAALVSALNSMPKRLAQSHYNHVSALVNSLGGYRGVSYDYYMNTLVPKANNAIKEYKSCKIYGSAKPSISAVESRGEQLVIAAMNYYSE